MKRRLGAAALFGALTVFAFAPFFIFPLPLLTLALLFVLWGKVGTASESAWLGFVWGLGCYLGGVSWVYVSMHDVGGMALPVAALATLLFCATLALFPALAGYLFTRLTRPEDPPWRRVLAAAGAWVIAEWLRGWVLTGFPWLAIGYSQSPPSPLAGFAPILGVHGVGFLLAALAALLAFALRRVYTAVAIVLVIGTGIGLRQIVWTQTAGPPLSVSLLQGNIEQSLKWDPERLRLSLDTYTRLAVDNPAALTVLPETALPMLLDQVGMDTIDKLTSHGAVLFGVPMRTREGGYANAAVALSGPLPGGNIQVYTKSHLVPFGDYIPAGFSWFLDLMHIPMSNFSPGPPEQAPLDIAGQKIAPNICYEDIFGEEILRSLPQATLLINMSNTAWFGDSLAQPQQLQIARMRAMETGRTMLRAGNTGMTAMVKPDGSVAAVLPAFTAGALKVQAQGYAGLTPYASYGNTPIVIAALLALLPAVLRRRTRSRELGRSA
jgi:apolipoprotein N-acyltransferase